MLAPRTRDRRTGGGRWRRSHAPCVRSFSGLTACWVPFTWRRDGSAPQWEGGTMSPARLCTWMFVPPEPPRKWVTLGMAVSKVVSAPANAGHANQRQANRRRAMATIARSVRPLFFRTDCMLGSLHMETRRIRAQVEGWSDALRGCNGRPEEVTSIRPSFRSEERRVGEACGS